MIKALGLTKKFDKKTALNGIDLEIPKGSIFGLIGSNGSGKSTLLRLISGVYKPDTGKITVDGRDVFNNPAVKERIAYLSDTPYFMQGATIEETARLSRLMYPTFDEELYKRLLTIFPLDSRAKISLMSKGMQRQAALITRIACCPDYLLLDEAFDGLDAVVRRLLKEILIEGAEDRNMTTVIASHNIRELEDLCDRAALIHDGDVLFNDTLESLKSSLHKVQAAFSRIPEVSAFSGLNVLKTEKSGSVINMIVRGDEADILKYINRLNPIFAETVEPSLEEMFIYELEESGYDVKSITE